ncbi:ABC transporter ATP-binding protein [Anthocerotibacter panamensis]|uniref:ABC transporter ATP-binding protein n=1 Tax=Anthocerotibacter panamensis TaxID=2857077 RepID=UPI001C407B58|nr:ABC transporter ATP-binding protein [Anthocerotibacter panamensis]
MNLVTQELQGGYGEKLLIQGVNFVLGTGEWVSLLGPNGSGKSTLLRLLSRILTPSGGVVLLDGEAIHTQPPWRVAQKMALLPQHQTVPQGLTVRQLVSLGRTPYQPWWRWSLSDEDQAKIEQALIQTQIQALSERPLEHLSGGERQRAFLALALAQDPRILLLDEPTTYLDLRYQLELLALLHTLNQERHLSILSVLHELNLAARYSHRLALLKKGRIVALGTVGEVMTPAYLAEVFGVAATILDTPIGPQICALGNLAQD